MKKTLALMLLLAGLTLEARAETLVWNGTEEQPTWNTDAGNTNWKSGDTQVAYTDGCDVEFLTENEYREVKLTGQLAPKSVLVNVNTDPHYIFSGEGSLTGEMTLVKDGNGMLEVYVSNSYSGTTIIKRGAFVMWSDTALGTSDVQLGTIDWTGDGNIATLDMRGHTIDSSRLTLIGEGSIYGGTLSLSGDFNAPYKLILDGRLVTTTLALNNHTYNGDLSVLTGAYIGGGTINGDISVPTPVSHTITLSGDLRGTGVLAMGIPPRPSLESQDGTEAPAVDGVEGSTDVDDTAPRPVSTSTLNMGGYTLYKDLELVGDATITNGTLLLKRDMIYQRRDKTYTLTVDQDAKVDLNGHSFLHNLYMTAEGVTIGNGTIGGSLTVREGTHTVFLGKTYLVKKSDIPAQIFYDGHIKAGDTYINPLQEGTPGLLQDLVVTDGLIIGTDRRTSLADGLDINRYGHHMELRNLILTDNNKITVGNYTITLKNVTIKLSQNSYELLDDVYYFKLSDLFHCSVYMEEVTFDASDLTLPEDFDPEKVTVSFDLGEARLTDATAKENIYLLLGGYGSQTMCIDEQGRPVFTKLVPVVPEPTTGTLSLLALAGLAARRRK